MQKPVHTKVGTYRNTSIDSIRKKHRSEDLGGILVVIMKVLADMSRYLG